MSQTTNSTVRRFFTKPKAKGYDGLAWVKRDALIKDAVSGEVTFEQKAVEAPESWSLSALNTVAQRYFAGMPGTPERETSLKSVIDRVVDPIVRQGQQEGYFDGGPEAETFREELKYILASQRAAFNSPVWGTIGVLGHTQQASACFILGVSDTLPDIMQWYVDESGILQSGLGSGLNVSSIRSSTEKRGQRGDTASGPLGFMRAADALAAALKHDGKNDGSADGKTRVSKMVLMNVDHPDVEEFIWCKAIEQDKSHALQAAGFDMSSGGKDHCSLQYQNATNVVRLSDAFMHAVENDEDWELRPVTSGEVVGRRKARDLWRQISEAAWKSGDPSLQFDTTINNWHTTPSAGPIRGSSPHGDYLHLDNSACNFASINLLKYLRDDGSFDIDAFKHTVELVFTAQEILVGYSEYPTPLIAKNAKAYRQLGIGYANLGALLLAQGLAYDSAEGRAQAAAITALLTGHSYATSAKMAQRVGPFAGYHKDREGMLRVLQLHREAVGRIDASLVAEDLLSAAAQAWDEANELAELYGVRNAQVSALAATSTISQMMDCDSAGIEPNSGLVKVQSLADGSTIHALNQTVPRALKTLGYTPEQIADITAHIDTHETILAAPHLQKIHEPVFAGSAGDNLVSTSGHLTMMAAVQPFLSGGISKTITVAKTTAVEGVAQIYFDAWKLGLKAVSAYREGSEVAPDSIGNEEAASEGVPVEPQPPEPELAEEPATAAPVAPPITLAAPAAPAAVASLDGRIVVKGAVRRQLPRIRNGKTYQFEIADLEGYFTVGEYEDGAPGELFIYVSKQGSTLSGLMDSFAISVSHGLQYGVPLKSYVRTLRGTTFAPSGTTDDPAIRTASSITDYIMRRLALDYLSFDDRLELGLASLNDMSAAQTSLLETAEAGSMIQAVIAEAPGADAPAPLCYNCGNQTQRSGNGYVCTACGLTTRRS